MKSGTRIIVFGRQGAGKGTQCQLLARHYRVPHISTGEMLRNAVKQDSVVGRAAKSVLERGELVEDELMISLVQGRIGQPDARTAGFVLDGFPRTIRQAVAFDEITAARKVQFVIDLDVDREIVVKRLSARRICESCSTIYIDNGVRLSPWKCEECGGNVIQRSDDTVAAINHRLDVYDSQTSPLISYYQEHGTLHVVDGAGTPDEVFARLKSIVGTSAQI